MNRKLALSAISGLALTMGGSAMADVDVWTAGPGLGALITDDGYDGSLASMTAISIDVTRGDIIKDVNVTIGMMHTWAGDLTIKIVGPGFATPVTLLSRAGFAEVLDDGDGCCGDSSNMGIDFRLTYDDEAASGKSAELMGDTIDTGDIIGDPGNTSFDNFIPAAGAAIPGDLSSFDATSAVGTWTLYVGDGAGGDTGFVDYVAITIDSNAIPAPGALALLGLAGLAGRRRRA